MEKNKKEIILLIIIVFIGINYAIYAYLINTSLVSLKNKQMEFNEKKQELITLERKKLSIVRLQKELEKSKVDAAALDRLAPFNIDTPQLIYDFYTYCKKYNVIGENLTFQLLPSGNTTSQGVNVAPSTVNTPSPQVNNTISAIKKDNFQLASLSININVSGAKTNIELFLKNLDHITSRKLNVANITLTMKSSSQAVNNKLILTKGDTIEAQITFNQYVQSDEKKHLIYKKYNFYNSKTGYGTISDMFKSSTNSAISISGQ